MWGRAIAVGLVLAGLMGSVPSAEAVQVSPGGYWDVIDNTGVNNNVVITQVAPDRIRVEDTAGVTFLGGCTAESPQSAVCGIALPLTGQSLFNMGEGDDSLDIVSFPFLSWGYGEAGNDKLTAPIPERISSLPTSPFNLAELFGGPGNDVLTGNVGEDVMKGGTGDDQCIGGLGPDICRVSEGNDTCDMGSGNDLCGGGTGRDLCLAGPGNDRCKGGRGTDRCDGGPGRDRALECERLRRFELITRP
jgi:hypothetical protein